MASVSQDGRVVVPRWSALVQLWSFDPEALAGTPQAITRDGAPKFALSLDRRGERIVYTAVAGPLGRHRMEIRVRELASGEETVPRRLAPFAISLRPRLSPDGALLAWEELADGKFVSFVGKTSEPGGQEQCKDCRLVGFTSDGRRVLLRAGPRRVFLRDLSSGSETPVFEQQAGTLLDADLSGDDRWLATLVGGPDRTAAIHVVPVADGTRDGTGSVEIARSDRWLSSPRWSPDGNRLYYMAVDDGFLCIWARAVDPTTKAPRGEPFAVFHAHRNPWRMMAPRGAYSLAVAPDRLVFNAAELTGSVLMAKLPPE
jgi:dipeptidyl aminopeptidase/acylaminoacyl peptidase